MKTKFKNVQSQNNNHRIHDTVNFKGSTKSILSDEELFAQKKVEIPSNSETQVSRKTLSEIYRRKYSFNENTDSLKIKINTQGVVVFASQSAKEIFDIKLKKGLEDNRFEYHGFKRFIKELNDLDQSNWPLNTFKIFQLYYTDRFEAVAVAVQNESSVLSKNKNFTIHFLGYSSMVGASQLLSECFNLTRSETEVTKFFLEGRTLREISIIRRTTYKTVRNQVQSVLEKTNLASKTKLMCLGRELMEFAQKERADH